MPKAPIITRKRNVYLVYLIVYLLNVYFMPTNKIHTTFKYMQVYRLVYQENGIDDCIKSRTFILTC